MTQPQAPSISSFFSGGGGKSLSWKDMPIGTTYTGTIKTIHPPQPQTDPATKEVIINKRTGQPKYQVRIDLATTYRDATDPDDDGSRGLYVGGWMQGAIGDALRKAGAENPEVGGVITVQLSERQPNDVPGLAPINKFVAAYQPPSPAAGFFAGNGQQPVAQQYAQPVQQPVAPPQQAVYQQPALAPQPVQQFVQPPLIPGAPQPNIAAPGYAPPPAPQPIAQPHPAPEPPKPDAISQAAWDTMDLPTKTQLASTIGAANLPPF